MKILGIESSCDESSASVVNYSSTQIEALSVATHSQIEIHRPFGGVVPEIASRNHLETINEMIDLALKDAKTEPKDLDAIAVTNRPGLVGALLVGVSAAKTLAYALNKPLVAVHHLEGHLSSLFIDQDRSKIKYPIALATISGGHTHLHLIPAPPEDWPIDLLNTSLLGRSRDDAAGEAFDKTAKLLGFPYPGGVWIDRESKGGNNDAYQFPRALPQKDVFDFSFSGLKTAVSVKIKEIESQGNLKSEIPNLCASIQEAIVDAILRKLFLACKKHKCQSIAIVGGVAANSRLRARLDSESPVDQVLFPKMEYCTDNAAMIAAAGAIRFRQGHSLSRSELLQLNAIPYPES